MPGPRICQAEALWDPAAGWGADGGNEARAFATAAAECIAADAAARPHADKVRTWRCAARLCGPPPPLPTCWLCRCRWLCAREGRLGRLWKGRRHCFGRAACQKREGIPSGVICSKYYDRLFRRPSY